MPSASPDLRCVRAVGHRALKKAAQMGGGSPGRSITPGDFERPQMVNSYLRTVPPEPRFLLLVKNDGK